jgi:hypothetical protein
MSYILDILEGDVVDFSAKLNARKTQKSDEFHKKLSNVAASMSGVFAKQNDIESHLNNQVKSIDSEGANRFALPHLMKDYQKGINSIHVLKFTAVDKSDPNRQSAVDHIKRNHSAIMSHIDDKLEKFKGLSSLADKAPAPQYTHRIIGSARREWDDHKDYFGKEFPKEHGL